MTPAKILIVDDDAVLLELFDVAFSTEAIEIVVCASSIAALELLARETFAVVVTDVQMPGLDGEEFCRRAAAACPDTPVVVMTGRAGDDAAVAALRAGARDFFTKPFPIESTQLRLERLVEEHRTRAELRRLRARVAAEDGA